MFDAKNCKASEFWQEVASFVIHSGKEMEQLIKNLGVEYQKVKQHVHLSGADTSSPPVLRNSDKIFLLSEAYYELFFPQGGSTVPLFVMTVSGVQQTPV